MTFKVAMLFDDGSNTAIAEPVEAEVRACLSDPVIQRLVKHFLKLHQRTQGTVIIWGRGNIATINVIDATQIIKNPEDLENGS